MKKIVIIGGNGTVGKLLAKGLSEDYIVELMDKNPSDDPNNKRFIIVDAANYQSLLSTIPKDTDVLVNLLAIKTSNNITDINEFEAMTDIYFKASYYILRAALELKIPKVIFASSNHVTDYYEENGFSMLGREITTKDYPRSKGLYGLLKLASENLGDIFTMDENVNLSVVNLRIGTVIENETEALSKKPRTNRTMLSHTDLVNIFTAAIDSTIQFGTYYAVSDNLDHPWSVESAIRELGYKPTVNSTDVKENKGE
ncbi:NAD-dependent epimerase/dehydratase family protein [Metabacillus arenae]|uniref:NAD(P)-dependent oxidoreductase n=1 Tax=Metabacillus arenae TaxID=2771434 RepID=A0A926NKP9_9BACI|nr:NAD(P)-dependent oxidoreductase [Metabacillus arenae]MBD1382530.1 NAD(P)-dependent oxidoreductase [Metabacillus arenae]